VYLYQRLLSFMDRAFIARIRSDDDGQGLAEYALILALIAIIAIISLIFLGSQISDKLHIVGTTLENVQ
jgi:pilus assembly protein Flp/PilA